MAIRPMVMNTEHDAEPLNRTPYALSPLLANKGLIRSHGARVRL